MENFKFFRYYHDWVDLKEANVLTECDSCGHSLLHVFAESPDPEVPEVPEVPKDPEILEVPEVPKDPEVPEVPDVPEVPKGPEVLEVPEVPEVTKLTSETKTSLDASCFQVAESQPDFNCKAQDWLLTATKSTSNTEFTLASPYI